MIIKKYNIFKTKNIILSLLFPFIYFFAEIFFQYAFSADVYSLTIIIFELFSGIDPFPGTFDQIYEAKRLDEKPSIPSDFPSELKELVIKGWSKDPKKRPGIHEFMSALNKMLVQDERQSVIRNDFPKWPETNSSKKREETESGGFLGCFALL
jgi:serine/threonine protein kinase